MTDQETQLVKTLAAITHALQVHIADEAHRRHCSPSEYCPCTDNEIAEAIALLAHYGAKPTH